MSCSLTVVWKSCTHPKSLLLPSCNSEETSFSSFFSLNTPIQSSLIMRQEREWGHFKMGENGGWVLVKGWIEAGSHVAVYPTRRYRAYLVAVILKQTLSDTTPRKTPLPRPHTDTTLMTEGRSVISRRPLTFTYQRSTGSLSKVCCLLQLDSSSCWKFKDKITLRT